MKRLRVEIMRRLALVLASQLAFGCGQQSPEQFIHSGQQYLAERDYPAAVIQLKNAIQGAPNSGEARYLLGMALRGEGDLRSAEIELRKAASAGYSPDLVYPALVRILLAQGQFENALADAAHDVTTPPARAELRALAGEAQLGLRKVDEAREAFASALAVQPANDTATLGMARLAAISGDRTKAQQLLREILDRSPTLTDALLLNGGLLAVDGKAEEAMRTYDQAIAAEPLDPRAYLSVVPLLLHQGQVAAARERVDALKKLSPGRFATLYLDALVSYSQGHLPAARDSVLVLLKAAPDSGQGLLLAGAVAHDSGDYTQAEEHLKKAVSMYPNAEYPRRLLASTLLRAGHAERAKEQLATLLKQQPQNPAVLSLAGEIALAKREVKEAAEYFQRAIALNPKDVRNRTRLGQARLAAGDPERAVQDLELASNADEQQYQADVALVVLHLSRREAGKALAAAEVLAKKQPNNPITYNMRGLVYLAQKDRVHARTEFEHALQLRPTYFPATNNLAAMDVQDGKPDIARQRYEQILAVDGKHEQALLAITNLLQQSRAPAEEVEKAIDRTVRSNPQSVRAHSVKIAYALGQGDTKAALLAAQQAIAAVPGNPQLLAALGQAQLAAGDSHQAIATLGSLSSLVPRSAAPLVMQAQAFAALEDWEAAHRVLSKGIEIQPESLPLRVVLLEISTRAKQWDRAQSEAVSIQKRWPTRAAGYIAQANVLSAQGKSAEAERVLRQAFAKLPNAPLAVATLRLLHEHGRKDEAEAIAGRWIKQHPDDIVVASFLAAQSLGAKDYAAAIRWYRAALDAKPNAPATLNNIAWALGQLKDPAAIDYAKKAAKLAPSNPAILDTLGWLQADQGQINEGIELLTRAHALAPKADAIQLNLAKALLKAGRTADARAHLDALTKLPPESASRKEAEQLLARG